MSISISMSVIDLNLISGGTRLADQSWVMKILRLPSSKIDLRLFPLLLSKINIFLTQFIFHWFCRKSALSSRVVSLSVSTA